MHESSHSWAKSKALAYSHNYRNKQDNFIIVFYYYHRMLLVIMDTIIMFWLNKQKRFLPFNSQLRRCAHRKHIEHILSTSYQSLHYNHKHIGGAIISVSAITHILMWLFQCSPLSPSLCLSLCFSVCMQRKRQDPNGEYYILANMQTIQNGCGFHTKNIIATYTYIHFTATFVILSYCIIYDFLFSALDIWALARMYVLVTAVRAFDCEDLVFNDVHFTKYNVWVLYSR